MLAFLVARAVIKCGLGARVGHGLVSVFGRSTLGLSYSIFLLDAVIAPAFPSNTARSGVLYPLAVSLAETAGAKAGDPSRQRLGSFLMFSGIASLSLSSALWLTAMAANPLALFGVFLDVGVKLGVPAAPLALQLLFATNYFAAVTPQGSSANLLFAGSGYLSQAELYRLGAITTALNTFVYLVIGTPWLMLVLR